MNNEYKNLAESLFGILTNKELTSLLLNATTYPSGTYEDIKNQLLEYYNQGARSFSDVIKKTDIILEQEYQNYLIERLRYEN